jgi:ubiquitin C-terminal hydrolase
MKGLRGAGGGGFLAAVQCLLHAPQLVNYFLDGKCAEEDLQRKRLNACRVAQEFGALAEAFWRDADQTCLDASPLHAAVAKANRGFARAGGAADAHESMLVLLRCLHDALAKTKPVPQSLAAQHAHAGAWEEHAAAAGYSFLTEVFQGQIETVTASETAATTAHEHFWDLSLSIEGCTSVQQAIVRFLAPETAEGYAPGDGSSSDVRLVKTPTWLPLVLVVHLKRFDAARRRKVDKFVDYTVELDLSGAVRSNEACRYSLFGVCLHAGEAAGAGHHTALCEVRGRWFHANGEACDPIDDLNALIQKDAYVLLYKRDL